MIKPQKIINSKIQINQNKSKCNQHQLQYQYQQIIRVIQVIQVILVIVVEKLIPERHLTLNMLFYVKFYIKQKERNNVKKRNQLIYLPQNNYIILSKSLQ